MRLSGLSIEAEHRDIKFFIPVIRAVFPGLCLSTDAVFGPIESCKMDARGV